MNTYSIGIEEVSRTSYVVEAETPEEAWRLFLIWADNNSEEIFRNLEKNYCGLDVEKPVLTNEKPDITHAELLSVAAEDEGGNE